MSRWLKQGALFFSPSHLFIRQKGAYTQGVGQGVTLLTAVTNGFSKPIFHITGSGLGLYMLCTQNKNLIFTI